MSDANQKPNLYLVGFMGTGKSSVGRLLAPRLGLRFIDSDHAIEEKEGLRVPLIFEEKGEPYFRELERDFIEAGHQRTGCVVACGGGLIVQPGMAERLRELGIVASLFARPETIYERTSRNQNRPLLQVEDPRARITEMLEKREPYYLRAGACFMTDFRPLSEVANHIAAYYQRAVPDFAPAPSEAERKGA
ncbi:MAG: shikimate kinase [Opitutales bacterium]